MKAPDLNAELSVTMRRKDWYRIQTILALLGPATYVCVDNHSYGFTARELAVIRQCRSIFNRALQRASAADSQPTTDRPEERRITEAKIATDPIK